MTTNASIMDLGKDLKKMFTKTYKKLRLLGESMDL